MVSEVPGGKPGVVIGELSATARAGSMWLWAPETYPMPLRMQQIVRSRVS